jgi:hypothetical protein
LGLIEWCGWAYGHQNNIYLCEDKKKLRGVNERENEKRSSPPTFFIHFRFGVDPHLPLLLDCNCAGLNIALLLVASGAVFGGGL